MNQRIRQVCFLSKREQHYSNTVLFWIKGTSCRTIFAQCETQYFQLLQQVIKARGRLIGSSSPFCPKMYRQKILLIWGTQLASASIPVATTRHHVFAQHQYSKLGQDEKISAVGRIKIYQYKTEDVLPQKRWMK